MHDASITYDLKQLQCFIKKKISFDVLSLLLKFKLCIAYVFCLSKYSPLTKIDSCIRNVKK